MSGIRPEIAYSGNEQWCSLIELTGDKVAEPDKEVDAIVHFLSPTEHEGQIEKGTKFKLSVANIIIGTGYFTNGNK